MYYISLLSRYFLDDPNSRVIKLICGPYETAREAVHVLSVHITTDQWTKDLTGESIAVYSRDKIEQIIQDKQREGIRMQRSFSTLESFHTSPWKIANEWEKIYNRNRV